MNNEVLQLHYVVTSLHSCIKYNSCTRRVPESMRNRYDNKVCGCCKGKYVTSVNVCEAAKRRAYGAKRSRSNHTTNRNYNARVRKEKSVTASMCCYSPTRKEKSRMKANFHDVECKLLASTGYLYPPFLNALCVQFNMLKQSVQ